MADKQLADIEGGPIRNTASIFVHIESGLKKNPDEPAVISMSQAHGHLGDLVKDLGDPLCKTPVDDNTCLTWTYRQLHGAAMKVAAGLLSFGIEPGMRIVTLVPNRIEWQLTLWTSTLLHVTLSSLDPGSTTKPRRAELQNFMTQIQPQVIIVPSSEDALAVEDALKTTGIHPPKVMIQLDGEPSGAWNSLSEVALAGTKHPIDEEKLLSSAREEDPDRIALIMFTSGTSSGNPKGCPRHVASTTHSQETQDWGPSGFNPKSRALAATANFRIIAPTIHLAIWRAGGATVLPDPSKGMKGWIDAVEQHHISFLLFIPALLHALLAHPGFETSDISSVQDIMVGADMITRDLLLKTQSAFPKANVAVGHGMTEGGGVFKWVWWGQTPEHFPYFAETIAPLGRVAPGARLRIRDPESGKVVERNEPGELCIRAESIVRHYLNHINEDTAFYTDPEGLRWFRTGDLATIDQDANVYILGRIKDIIKRAGISITPAALESTIEKFTGSYTSVLAWPDDVLGQVPVAVVKDLKGSGKSESEVKDEVLAKFGKDYAMGRVAGLEQLGLESFPLNATGKIMKPDLVPALEKFFASKEA